MARKKVVKTISGRQSNMKAHPFLKWAGGKRGLLTTLESHLPEEIKETKKIKKYIEPFIGAGAFFFHLNNFYDIEQNIINDVNEHLMNTYKAIKRDHVQLIQILHRMHIEYREKIPVEDSSDKVEQKKYYLMIRDFFNDPTINSLPYMAAYFIFLNKTCFNGLYRVNRKGKYNVGYGSNTNVHLYSAMNIRWAHEYMKNTKILCGDNFKIYYPSDMSDCMVYLDPPYKPVKENSFVSYQKGPFADAEQIMLFKQFETFTERGAKVMLSNSNHDFFRDLYKDYNIYEVEALRSINCDGAGRGKVKELIIKNY